MSSNAVPLGTPLTRDAAGTLLGQTVGLVAVTTGLFAVGASLGRDLSLGWGWLGFLAAFGCLIAMHLAVQRSEGLAITLLFGFGLLIGVATAPTPRRSGRPASPSSFVQIPGGAVIYASVGLVIFAGLTAFDFQRLRRSQDLRTAPLLAASIFLDLLNVFQLFLLLFGREDQRHSCSEAAVWRFARWMAPGHMSQPPAGATSDAIGLDEQLAPTSGPAW